jgi:phage shock protein PspC (stress-responsive transcriptional regulator)
MKKVININFQGRVVPIEESAYEMLKQYTESLRRYFDKEEGRDEIINDIESRIAELFNDRLKKGATCITDEDVSKVIATLGRPEEFDAEGVYETTTNESSSSQAYTESRPQAETTGGGGYTQSKRLFRNENDKILGGVCSGLANYLNIDPVISRIIFGLSFFVGGLGFLAYIILWIVVPSKSLYTNIKKRLYRSVDDRMIGGVAGGLASYLDTKVFWVRFIFALPLILGVFAEILENVFDVFNNGNIRFAFNGGFGGTLFVSYIILWIVLPEARSASEKLEMRGEKVDLNSIRNTVMEDLQGFKEKAQKFGEEVKEKSKEFGNEFRNVATEKGQSMAADLGYAARKSNNGIGHAIGILFKAFVLFIIGIIVFSLVMSLVALLAGGVGFIPAKSYLLDGFWQNTSGWGTLILFLGIPILALVVWIIRRSMKVKSQSPYLRYAFIALWTMGFIAAFFLASSLGRDFSGGRDYTKTDWLMQQPAKNNLLLKLDDKRVRNSYSWLRSSGFGVTNDSMFIDEVVVKVLQSEDSLYHVQMVKVGSGANDEIATRNAEAVNYSLSQNDTVLTLPRYFSIAKGNKWRYQQIAIVVRVPNGKQISFDRNMYRISNRNIDLDINNRNDENDRERELGWDNEQVWQSNRTYTMTAGRLDSKEDKNDELKKARIQEVKDEEEKNNYNEPNYRYNDRNKDTIKIITGKDTTIKITVKDDGPKDNEVLTKTYRFLPSLALIRS